VWPFLLSLEVEFERTARRECLSVFLILVDVHLCTWSDGLLMVVGRDFLLNTTELTDHHIASKFRVTSGIHTWNTNVENSPSDQEGTEVGLFHDDVSLTQDLS
jgi:hypothetical protein